MLHKLEKFFLLFWIISTPVSSYAKNPYDKNKSPVANPFGGSTKSEEVPKKEAVIVVGNGVLFNQEQAAVVASIWNDLKSNHSYSEDGEIIEGLSGAPLTNSPEMVAVFYNYVSANELSKEVRTNERCQACKGSGVIYVYSDDFAQRLSPTRTECMECSGSGKVLADITYKLVCPADRLPAKPKSPRQNKQDALMALVKKGDVKARLEHAIQLKDGTVLVSQNLEMAKDVYAGLACDGVAEGLRGYLNIVRLSENQIQQRRLQNAFHDVVARMGQGMEADSGKPEVHYLDQLQTKILADRLFELISSKKAQKKHLTYMGLLSALERHVKPDFRDVVIEWMQQPVGSRFDLEQISKLMKFAEANDPGAFAALGSISEQGLHSVVNMQAAHIFYSLAFRVSNDASFRVHGDRVVNSCNLKLSEELLGDFEKSKVDGRCSRTYLNAVMKVQ